MAADPTLLPAVFDAVKAHFPHNLTPHGWYILTTSALITTSSPENMAHLYAYLTSQPEWETSPQRRVLSRRLREQLMKQWVVVGIPRTVTALRAIVRLEKPEDWDSEYTRGGHAMDTANRERGEELLEKFYGDETETIFHGWGAHREDFKWLAKNIIYGLFFSDETVLNTVEVELIVYTAITCQDLRNPTRRHLRGLRRFGVALREVEAVTDCVKMVAEWAGKDTSGWAGIRELEPDFEEDKD